MIQGGSRMIDDKLRDGEVSLSMGRSRIIVRRHLEIAMLNDPLILTAYMREMLKELQDRERVWETSS